MGISCDFSFLGETTQSMKHFLLLAVLYGASLLFSFGFRPYALEPPYTIATAKEEVVGVWRGKEGQGKYETRIEIVFGPRHSYTLRTKTGTQEWEEMNGFYDVIRTRDPSSGDSIFAVSFSETGGLWYFRGGERLYEQGGGHKVSKDLDWTGVLIWMLAIPVALASLPAKLLWHKVGVWGRD